MTSPSAPPTARPASFDEWLQALREQASFFTGLRLDVGAPRWLLADVLPVIGAGVGLAAGLVFAVVQALAPGWLAAVLAVATAVLLTRALHEDGLADTADGLGPHGLDTPRRLEIMRDSRNGTFGVLALALSVLAKVGCLASFGGSTGLVVLIAAHAVSRAAIAYPLLAFGPAQSDGLGPHGLGTPRRLEIMRDSRNGTFGVLAIALTVLIKVACLAQFSGSTGFAVLIAAHALSRAVIAYPLLAFSPVRQDGLGVQAGKPTDNDVWLAIGLGVAIAFLLLLGKGFFVAILAPAAAVAVGCLAARWIAQRIGGYTGDTLGAVQQKAETVFLIVAALFIPH